jgi:hypothetical protein
MRGLRRFFPFTTVSGALWFALRHRQPLLDWAGWTARSVPRLVDGEHRDLLAEARLRARLRTDVRTAQADLDVKVEDGRALLWGRVDPTVAAAAADLALRASGVDTVRDDLEVLPPPSRRSRRAERRQAA